MINGWRDLDKIDLEFFNEFKKVKITGGETTGENKKYYSERVYLEPGLYAIFISDNAKDVNAETDILLGCT